MGNPQETKQNLVILLGSSETIRYAPNMGEDIVQIQPKGYNKLNFLLPLLEFSNFSSRTRLQSSRNKEGSSTNHVIVGGRYSNHPRLFLNKRRYSTAYNSPNNKVKLDP